MQEGPGEETTTDTVSAASADNIITVNVAIAVKIDPARWSLADQSEEDLLTVKIMAEKGIAEGSRPPAGRPHDPRMVLVA